MIEVKGVSKRYGDTLAVDNVSFTVNRGEIVGFLGPNGAGKSTTMKVLTCYIAPTAGTAAIDGIDILERPLEARSHIGYLPESTPLYEDMGVLDFLEYMAAIERVPGSRRRGRVNELVELCGIQKMAHKSIGELSKGYRQRVGLAQALLGDPPVLILDEPTSGLDPGQIVEIRQLIKDISPDKAILLSTHILPEAQNTCNRVLIISDGRIVGEGTPAELLAMARGEDRYTVTFKGGGAGSAGDALARLPRVSGVDQLSANGSVRYRVTAESGSSLSEQIFDYAIASNLKLLELTAASTSLEDVFLRLTGGSADGVVIHEPEALAGEDSGAEAPAGASFIDVEQGEGDKSNE